MAGPSTHAKVLIHRLPLLALAACGPTPAPEPPEAGPVPTAEPDAPPIVANHGPMSPAEPSASQIAPPSAPKKPAWPEVAFPPAKVEPPSKKSAVDGDGAWTRLGSAGERIADGAPTMFKTVIHPHDVSRFISVTVVAIDLSRVEPYWVPGTDDPRLDQLPDTATPGLIPTVHHDKLLVVTNGGFAPRHGRWEWASAG